MIAIAIDDEPQALEVIRVLADKIPFLTLKETFTDALEAMTYLQEQEIDLVFLDIKMPDISGLDWVRGLSDPPMVIFTTAYSEYAADSYELEAVDYLVKPVAFNRFLKAVNRAAKLHKQDDKASYMFVKSGFQYVRIDFESLLYIQGASNYVDFFTDSGKVTVRMKLNEASELLPEEFVQIHRSYLVNLSHIRRVEHNHVQIGEASLSIGTAYKSPFLEKLDQRR